MISLLEARLLDERKQKIAQIGEFNKNSLVELGDTASPSETSPGYNSTHIVFCFILVLIYQQQKTKLINAMAIFRAIFRQLNNLNPIV